MNHFALALKKLCKGKRQQDIAEIAGMPRSTLNQYLLGTRRVSVNVLEHLLKAFTKEEQKKLLVAYFKNQTPESWYGRIAIGFQDDKSFSSKGEPEESPDKELSRAFDILKNAASENDNVRQVLLDLAAIVF